jgi:hypothetical protein
MSGRWWPPAAHAPRWAAREESMGDERQRLLDAMSRPDLAGAILGLALALRAEGMGQIAMYRLFSEQQRLLPGNDPRYDAVIVKDKIRLLKDSIRDTIMETCYGLHNFRLQYRP